MGELRQREPRLVLPALTKLAEGKPCMMRVPGVCNGRTDTTCWAHSNMSRHGKGVGLKSHDCFGAFACHACHEWYDLTSRRTLVCLSASDREEAFMLAFERTLKYLWQNSFIVVHRRG